MAGVADPLKISVASLQPVDKDGYLTKQGGSFKTWKRRWFVLKGKSMYYFKTPKDMEAKGIVELEPESFVKDESQNKNKKSMFSVGTKKRVYFMIANTESEMKTWMEHVQAALDSKPFPDQNKSHTQGGDMRASPPSASPAATESSPQANTGSTPSNHNSAPRSKIAQAKSVVPFLQDEESKVLEFWQIWSESIPPPEDLSAGLTMEYRVAASADMQKLQWRVAGPQNVFIQKMVDFFWNVGAPESEIDKLNDVGALINPVKIGSWIDMSAKGGMDGGWYFPVDIPLQLAVEACDQGEPVNKVKEWADNNSVVNCYAVGRDMGAAPPRQTEIKIELPGTDFSNQLRVATDAFFTFGFPAIPEDALKILRDYEPEGLRLSIITSSEGFVRLGLLIPEVSDEAINAMYTFSGANVSQMKAFENALATKGPSWVEYQYLMRGYGYSVYKEGFDIVFHHECQ